MTWSILFIILVMAAAFAIITLLTAHRTDDALTTKHYILEIKAKFNGSMCDSDSIPDLNDSRCWTLVEERDIGIGTVSGVIIVEIISCLGILALIYYYCLGQGSFSRSSRTEISASQSINDPSFNHDLKLAFESYKNSISRSSVPDSGYDDANNPPPYDHRSMNPPAYMLVNTFET